MSYIRYEQKKQTSKENGEKNIIYNAVIEPKKKKAIFFYRLRRFTTLKRDD
jgi:hypothetical protein